MTVRSLFVFFYPYHQWLFQRNRKRNRNRNPFFTFFGTKNNIFLHLGFFSYLFLSIFIFQFTNIKTDSTSLFKLLLLQFFLLKRQHQIFACVCVCVRLFPSLSFSCISHIEYIGSIFNTRQHTCNRIYLAIFN